MNPATATDEFEGALVTCVWQSAGSMKISRGTWRPEFQQEYTFNPCRQTVRLSEAKPGLPLKGTNALVTHNPLPPRKTAATLPGRLPTGVPATEPRDARI